MLLLMVLLAAGYGGDSDRPVTEARSLEEAGGIHTVAEALQSLKDHENPRWVRPLANPGEWIRPDDYPPAALRNKMEGVTHFRLSIGPDGKPTACAVVMSSGSDLLDTTTCDLVRARALFTPAHDAKGKAIASSYSNTVRWQIPHVPPTPISPMDMTVAFDVDSTGDVSHCATNISAQGASPMVMGMTGLCMMLNGSKVELPAVEGGIAGKRRVTTRMIVTIDDPAVSGNMSAPAGSKPR